MYVTSTSSYHVQDCSSANAIFPWESMQLEYVPQKKKKKKAVHVTVVERHATSFSCFTLPV